MTSRSYTTQQLGSSDPESVYTFARSSLLCDIVLLPFGPQWTFRNIPVLGKFLHEQLSSQNQMTSKYSVFQF